MEEEKYIEDDLPPKASSYEPQHHLSDEGIISISPQGVMDLYPSRPAAPAPPRPTRESVLLRLSEALLGKTLTKVGAD